MRNSLVARMDFRRFSIVLLGFLCIIRYSETTVSAWSSPGAINTASGSVSASAISENPAVGATLFTATATATGAVTYTLTGNAGGKGTIYSTSGVVTLAAGQSIDYETSPSLQFIVVATTSDSTNGTATITLPITDVNEAPSFSSLTQSACISDDSAGGTTLGTYTATDPDTGNTIAYSIASGNTNTDFEIAGTTGVITVTAGKTLSQATTATYALEVKAIDSATTRLTGTTTVSVTVGDCSSTAVTAWTSPASIASPSGSANANAVDENVAVGTTLFIAKATGAATYSLTSNADGKGTINSTSGIVTLAKEQSIDYESTSSLKFVVVAAAKTGAGGTATIILPITDVNEAPEFSSATITACINKNSAEGTTLGTYTATDPDAGNTITYSIVSGNNNTNFEVSGTKGVITVATGKTISKATTATYGLVVNAVDSAGPKMTGTTTVSVTVGDCSGTGYIRVLMSLMLAAIVATQLF